MFLRELRTALIELNFLASFDASVGEVKEYHQWCRDNPNKSPIKCPVIDRVLSRQPGYNDPNPYLAMLKKEPSQPNDV